jgi:hypothetical protein
VELTELTAEDTLSDLINFLNTDAGETIKQKAFCELDENSKKELLKALITPAGCELQNLTVNDDEKILKAIFECLEAWTEPGSLDQSRIFSDSLELRKVALNIIEQQYENNASAAVQQLMGLLPALQERGEKDRAREVLKKYFSEVDVDKQLNGVLTSISNLTELLESEKIPETMRSDICDLARSCLDKIPQDEAQMIDMKKRNFKRPI